jgi:hypothetical protein
MRENFTLIFLLKHGSTCGSFDPESPADAGSVGPDAWNQVKTSRGAAPVVGQAEKDACDRITTRNETGGGGIGGDRECQNKEQNGVPVLSVSRIVNLSLAHSCMQRASAESIKIEQAMIK